MTKLGRMLDTLRHREPEVVPSNIAFADPNAQRKLVPRFTPWDWRKNEMDYLDFLDSYIVEVGHGELLCKVMERGEGYHIVEFESGVRWRITETPYWSRKYFNYPIQSEKDLEKMVLPDADDPRRYEGASKDDGRELREDGRFSDENDLARFVSVGERVDFFKSQGIFTIANINGFFSGVWYFWRDFKSFLLGLFLREGLAEEMIKRMAEYNLRAARNLLERGVHSIHFCDDLGSSENLFISPQMYEKYFYPWHKKLADLCHHHGAYAYMHSHGNINKIIPLIVKAGIDILNPVGPGDQMNLAELKQKYGDKITFCGGLSKYIGDMTRKELDSHVEQVLRVGSPGGGFIPREEGGVPYTMSLENFKVYVQVLKKYRQQYGRKQT